MSVAVTAPPVPSSAGRSFRGRGIAVVVLAAAAFLAIQAALALSNQHEWRATVVRAYARSAQPVPVPSGALGALALVIGASFLIYGSFVLAEVAIASRGHRFLWTVPPLAFVLLGVVVSPHAPNAIGSPWLLRCFDVCARPWYLGPWAGPIADLGLVMVPGAVVAAGAKRVHRTRRVGDAPTVAAILLCIALAIMVDRTAASLGGAPDLAAFVAVVTFGLLAGTARPWWPWTHLAFAAIASGALGAVVSSAARASYPWSAQTWVPVAAAVLIVSMWEPLASMFRRDAGRPMSMLVAVNVLNVADAVFTELGVRSGKAVELNPLIRFGGLPLKIVLVGAFTWLIYRRRPSTLLYPVIVLVWVVCYHISGLVVNR